MDMLGHDHVPDHHEAITPSHLFKNLKHKITLFWRSKKGFPTVTAEGNEMEVVMSVETFQMRRHRTILDRLPTCSDDQDFPRLAKTARTFLQASVVPSLMRRTFGTLAHTYSCSGKHCGISSPKFLTSRTPIQQY
jgi:hypothetical protein